MINYAAGEFQFQVEPPKDKLWCLLIKTKTYNSNTIKFSFSVLLYIAYIIIDMPFTKGKKTIFRAVSESRPVTVQGAISIVKAALTNWRQRPGAKRFGRARRCRRGLNAVPADP